MSANFSESHLKVSVSFQRNALREFTFYLPHPLIITEQLIFELQKMRIAATKCKFSESL